MKKKKVALLGDSIRQVGYGLYVPELLGERYEVFQPVENCRFAKHTLRGLYDWQNELKDCEVIHWNNGHWDICNIFEDGAFTSKEEYLTNVLRIARLLKKITPHVIFATTTPLREGHPHNDNALTVEYNEYVKPHLQALGVEINDLHALVAPHVEEYIREDDKIHLTEKGARVCAEQVAAYLRKYL